MRKIRAFTVMELVISLMISSIVISIAYYAWLLVSRQFGDYQERSVRVQEYVLFTKALETDLDRAVLLRDSAGLLNVYGKDGSVYYRFAEEYVLRQGVEFADTFRVGVKDVVFGYVHDTLPAVQKVNVVLRLNEQAMENIFYKQYSATELMNAEKYDHE
ncbi:MAG TPA: prepilin-type N-terminal cleavage/methylation domain-containing protein [Chitinophagaceae bacterium]|nr:prepilin-type N-terminal cleavage/methylation domain-containing protein [Chitinophagaceae bacterium]